MPYYLSVNVHELTTPTSLLRFNGKHKGKKLSMHQMIQQNQSLISVIYGKILQNIKRVLLDTIVSGRYCL